MAHVFQMIDLPTDTEPCLRVLGDLVEARSEGESPQLIQIPGVHPRFRPERG